MRHNHSARLFTLITVAAIALLIGAGCGKKVERGSVSPDSSLTGEFAGAPSWVLSKTCEKPWVDSPDNNLCGVGQRIVQSERRLSLAQNVAEADGAAKIAQMLSRRTESLVKRYQAEWVEEGADTNTAFEDKASEAIKQISKMDLPGVKPAASWISPNNNLYVLMVADADTVKEAIKSLTGLNERIKETISARSDELFKELDQAR